jgi:hypothetical protein
MDYSKHVKVDPVACPWLIQRFIDSQAQFLFVEEDELLRSAEAHGATPFDAPRLSDVKLNHRENRCTFEAILEDHALADPALRRLGLIVRSADIKGQESAAEEGLGLRAIAHRFALMGLSDEQRLLRQFPLYDALYEYCREALEK